jgi:hypothetical protein
VNEKISRLAAVKPYGDVYAAFSMAAHLAREAIQAVTELKQMPGVDPKEFQPVIDFWHRLEDLNRVAALDCAGGNQSLAEALVSFRLLRNLEE